MKHLFSFLVILCIGTGAASAECYADYKAKQDNPLRLHYGVIEVDGDDCTEQAARRQLRDVLPDDGWQLLNVMGIFDDAGLEERRESAGEYYLRY